MKRSVVILLLLAVGTAHAELTAAELQKTGEDLARAGRYTEAIDAFKAADKKAVRASHACLIALAYARKDQWTPAEIWDVVCHARASKTDPLPEWQGALEQQISTAVAALAPVSFVVDPDTGTIALDEFPDSPFGAATIHLAPGAHAITVTAPRFEAGHRTITVTGAVPQHVAVKLVAEPAVAAPAAETTYSKPLVVTGAVVAGVGVLSYAAMAYAWRELHVNRGFGTWRETLYDVTRPATIGLWAVGGGLVITGLLLRHDESAPAIAVTPIPAGGVVSVAWQR
ncbi:MAG TPA: hypothetical protein VGC41_24015 [Kofleriaceae bacterium]